MENNFPNDDENQDSSLSPKSGGKKQKLNDGSSQDSNKETGKYGVLIGIVIVTYVLKSFVFLLSIWK